ncbi:hypothetical protein [Gloeocapsopsis sp. IPPAS B-1203]|uniref:hypothetical protein n=1 Tax=Gloeocapsopsis sp. IPPAS B-1203 TaxID=2049454 RepID=UPI000C18441D|nr:hypothetical protein [Gloeocapsopsis sp. IPPAS B-1203]PIG90460.1 hypothetical protein CSQ79_26570 [Gloeocapsopsis sp. IPPAS B-1203]
MTGLFMQELHPGQSHTIIVDARNKWNSSGICLKPNFTYNFEVIQIDEKWQDDNLDSTPEFGIISPPFYLNFFKFLKRFSEANWYVLVGSVGKDKITFFKIGERLEHYIPPTSDEFYCFANDAEGFYFNNRGKLTLKISCL